MNDDIVSYCVKDSAGKVLRHGKCPRDQVAIQARTGESAVEEEPTATIPTPIDLSKIKIIPPVTYAMFQALEARVAALEKTKVK